MGNTAETGREIVSTPRRRGQTLLPLRLWEEAEQNLFRLFQSFFTNYFSHFLCHKFVAFVRCTVKFSFETFCVCVAIYPLHTSPLSRACARAYITRGQEPLEVGSEDPVLIAVQHYAKLLAFSEITWSTGQNPKRLLTLMTAPLITNIPLITFSFSFFQIFGGKKKK